MANGTDSDAFVLRSRVRPGLKRELAFALGQADVSGSLGRTRARKAQPELPEIANPNKRSKKKAARAKDEKFPAGEGDNLKVVEEDLVVESISEEDAKSDVVDGTSDDEPKSRSGAVAEAAKEEELKSGAMEMEIDNEDGVGSIGNGDELEKDQVKISEQEKPLKLYTRTKRKGPVAVDIVTEKVVSEDKMKNGAVDMAIDDEPPKQGEDKLNDSETKQPLAKLDILELIEKGDKVERETIGERRFTRSALKPKPEDEAVHLSSVSQKSAPLQLETRMPKEREPIGERRFTRSALKPKTENEAVHLSSVSQKTAPLQLETRMPKIMKKFRISKLLGTGVLEGQRVTYRKGTKVRKSDEEELTGVITGSGILCHCKRCKGTDVVSPANFELHAESGNKRPPEFIYLENGKTLRDVMTACDFSLETLEEAVQLAVGCSSIKTCTICLNCKGSICKDDTRLAAALICAACLELKKPKAKDSVAANDCFESPKLVSIEKGPDTDSKCPDTVKKCPVTIPECPDIVMECPDTSPDLPETDSECPETGSKFVDTISKCPDSSSRRSATKVKSSSSASKSRGKITRKDLGMHKLVFDFLPDGTEVAYFYKDERLKVGYKKGSGFVCSCCNKEVSPSQFEAHAGFASRRKPYHNIFTSNGASLHGLALKLSQMVRSCEKRDNLCGICKKGGNLISCKSCPRDFHAECISLPTVPTGSWYCNHCQSLFDKAKGEESNVSAVAAGRVAGVDPIKEITNRCIRIVTTFDEKFGGCVLCRGHDFDKKGFGPGTVILCDQCEKEFHVGCLKEKEIVDLKEVPKEKWFCHPDCLRIHTALQKLVSHGQQKLPDSLLNVIRKKHIENGSADGPLDLKWRVLSGKTSTDDESSLLLSKSLSIFHDQFAPIVDSETGLDFIKEMLYGGAIKTQDFGGVYCAIVTLNGLVVSAAMFRIYGSEVAELPLVATSADCQGQGYFQTLFSCIERFLAFLNVKILLLPAAKEAASIWKNKFGFQNLNQDEILECRKRYPILVFDGTSVLQKLIPKCRIIGSQESKMKVKADST